jgi:hypothetical protein
MFTNRLDISRCSPRLERLADRVHRWIVRPSDADLWMASTTTIPRMREKPERNPTLLYETD